MNISSNMKAKEILFQTNRNLEFITVRPTLEEIIKGLLLAEGKMILDRSTIMQKGTTERTTIVENIFKN